jgi:hypothetical protein
MKSDLSAQLMPQITGAAATAAVALVVGGLAALIGVNMKRSAMTGDNNIAPTSSGTTASNVETNGKNTSGGLRDDGLSASAGEVKAQNTNAAAADSDAKAMDTGASAARPKAGAADIQTKALNIT